MFAKRVMTISVIAIAFLGLLIWAVLTNNQLGNTKDELSSAENQLSIMTAELEGTTAKLADATTQLMNTRSELTSTVAELTNTKDELTGTETELTNIRDELKSTEIELTSIETELTSTKDQLGNTQIELASAKDELTNIMSDLASTEDELANIKIELASTEDDLKSAQLGSSSLLTLLSTTQEQLAVAQDTLGGLGITLYASKNCYDTTLADNPDATNPNWSQLMNFLLQDQTENHEYIENVYDCSEFSRDLHNNAEAAGIRAAEVQVFFVNEPIGHALNAFLTTDYGLVYVDCTEPPDNIARVELGEEYRAVELHRITGINVRDDHWWDTLSLYSYITATTGEHSVTSDIKIYW